MRPNLFVDLLKTSWRVAHILPLPGVRVAEIHLRAPSPQGHMGRWPMSCRSPAVSGRHRIRHFRHAPWQPDNRSGQQRPSIWPLRCHETPSPRQKCRPNKLVRRRCRQLQQNIPGCASLYRIKIPRSRAVKLGLGVLFLTCVAEAEHLGWHPRRGDVMVVSGQDVFNIFVTKFFNGTFKLIFTPVSS